MVASMEHDAFLTVEQVFFHDKQCCDNSQTFYPKSCGVTMFDFDKIIGKDTYEKAVSKINEIEVRKGPSNLPKNSYPINYGDPSYDMDNRYYMPLPDPDLGIDPKEHKYAIWRFLFYHVAVQNISRELFADIRIS